MAKRKNGNGNGGQYKDKDPKDLPMIKSGYHGKKKEISNANKPVAPAWCENAIPTANGWEDPDTGELYVSGGFTTEEIDLFHGKSTTKRCPSINRSSSRK